MASSEETASAEAPTTGSKRPALDIESLQKKKFKTEDLPLSVAQHAAIENLLKAFKKKGCFDNVRKKIWAEFNESVWHHCILARRSIYHLRPQIYAGLDETCAYLSALRIGGQKHVHKVSH